MNDKAKLLLLLLFMCVSSITWGQINITGEVADSSGEPIIGATVKEKGKSTNGTITNSDGRFSLAVAPNSTLVVSYIGYKTHEVKADGKAPMRILLEEDESILNEVVVVGYGVSKKRDLTGAVANMDIGVIESSGVTNVVDALGGRIAGLNVTSMDGAPGAEASISIRGGGFSQDASPLFIIDGFPIENFSLNTLDPKNIESIDVLKDASSIAIYGSRGANGVIIINTKAAREGKPRIIYNYNISMTTRPDFVKMMAPYEYVKMQLDLEALEDNRTYMRDRYLGKPDANGLRERSLDYYRNDPGTDWQKEITHNAISHNHSFNMSAGNKDMKYNIVLGYTDQKGLIINTGMERYSLKGSIEQRISKNLKASIQANHTTTITSSNNAFNQARQYFPTTGFMDINSFIEEIEQMLADGTLNDSGIDYGSLITPLQQAENEYDKRYQKQTSVNAKLEWKISKYLTFTPSFGATFTNTKRDRFYNSKTRQGMIFVRSTGALVNSLGVNANRNIDEVKSYLSENILRYNRKFKNGHKLDAIAGFTYQKSEWNPYSFVVANIPIAFEDMGFDRLDLGSPSGKINSQRSGNRLASLLGRVNYTIDDKYLFTASMRNDGSSKFAKGHQWGVFPSAAFAWRFMDEPFLLGIKPILSDGKLRLSYGTVGNNRSVMDYAYLLEFSPGDTLYRYPSDAFGNNTSYGLLQFFYANPEITWEKTKEFNVGLDLYFLNNRFNISADFYTRDVSNLLVPRVVPGYLGYGNGANTRVENAGETNTKGIELTINTTNIITPNFRWETDFTFGYTRSKIKEFYRGYDLMTSTYGNNFSPNQAWISQAGASTSQFFGYRFEGLYQESDFDRDSSGQYILKPGIPTYKSTVGGYRLQPGDPRYADLNGDGVIDESDRTTLGSPMPPIVGGIANTFTYKNLSLSVFFQYSLGNKVLNFNKAVYETTGSFNRFANQHADFANYWTPENQNTDTPRLLKPNVKGDVNNINAAKLSSRLIEDGSFLRFKTLTLGYTLPQKFTKSLGISNVSFNFSAHNLFVWTKYSGQDPEVNSYFGAGNGNLKGMGYNTGSNSAPYTSLSGGLDYAAYPRARSFNLGVNVTF